jgi:hypothetical protein
VPTESWGRAAELDAVEAFLSASARSPAALVVDGEPGIGKTTVWRAALELAREGGRRLLTTRLGEADAPLSFAGLTDLIGEIEPGYLAALPRPQREALDAALLRDDSTAAAPDARAVYTSVLSLLERLADDQPIVVAIDDLQFAPCATMSPTSGRGGCHAEGSRTLEAGGELSTLGEDIHPVRHVQVHVAEARRRGLSVRPRRDPGRGRLRRVRPERTALHLGAEHTAGKRID